MIQKKKEPKHLNSHVKTRIVQRYGLELNKFAIKLLNNKIANGEAEFLSRQSNTRTHWKLVYEGKEIYCVYNSKVHRICTVLTEQMYLEGKEKVDLYCNN
jgi:hypothetical protein